MSDITISPAQLTGTIRIPPSKSVCHRAIICAGLAQGTSRIDGVVLSDDINSTIQAMQVFGAVIQQKGDGLSITGTNCTKATTNSIDCLESGSTLRFLIPLALMGQTMTFTGRGKLIERPLEAYFNIFQEQQIAYQTNNGRLPLTVTGTLSPGQFQLPGNVSSQFVSGLLFALPRLAGDSSIIITSELESQGYVDLTLAMLARFGIKITNKAYREFIVPGKQSYHNTNYHIESDYSQAAFWLTAATLGSPINCIGLNLDSLQGDKVIIDIIRRMGGVLIAKNDAVQASPAQTIGTVIDAAQCPDLVPILTVLAAVSKGTTRIERAGRLRLKESDRLHAITQELNKLGADIEEKNDSLIIQGRLNLSGGVIVDSWHDHRIAMALAIASIKCLKPITIRHSECVAKSYPAFWHDFQLLGGKISECCMG